MYFDKELDNFKHFLLNKFRGEKISFYEIMEKTYMETQYIEKHYRKALLSLEKEGKIKIIRVPSITKKGLPRKGLNHKDIILFPS